MTVYHGRPFEHEVHASNASGVLARAARSTSTRITAAVGGGVESARRGLFGRLVSFSAATTESDNGRHESLSAAPRSVGRASATISRQTILILGPDTGAVSGVSTHLRQLFTSSLAERYELVHFQTGSEGRPTEGPADKIKRAVGSPLQLARTVAKLKPKVVFLNSATEPKAFWRDAAYLVVAAAMRQPVVLEVHGGYTPEALAGDSRAKKLLVRSLLRIPDRVVLLSSAEEREFRAYDRKLPITVIPNAIEVITGAPAAKPSTDDQPLQLLSLGRIVASKGVFEAVAAVAALRDQGIRVNLTIAGSGPDEPAVREAVQSHKVADRVRLVGPVSGQSKDRLLEANDVLVFPTYHREGLPYALLEAMAAGTVPITCPVAGIIDVLEGAGEPCGILVPPRDVPALAAAIAELHHDRKTARALSSAGHRRVIDAYQVPRMADDFAQLFGGM